MRISKVFLTCVALMVFLFPNWTVTQAEPPKKDDNFGVPGLLSEIAELQEQIAILQALLDAMQNYAPVPKTGQTVSYRTGDDGYYQKGIGWMDSRFTNHGNGTVTDHFTDLMWIQDISLLGKMYWEDAVDTCYNLDYAGYQDWRLPNIKELYSLTDYSQKRPRFPVGHPFVGYEGGHDWCWSSNTEFDSPVNAQVFSPGAGDVGAENKTTKLFKCWCVRGGP